MSRPTTMTVRLSGPLSDFVAINAYMIQLFIPLNVLGFVYREIRRALTDMQRMFVAWLAWYGSPTNACAELGKARSGIDKVYKSPGAESVASESIYDVDADIYAPCALGAAINDDTLPRLRVAIVASAVWASPSPGSRSAARLARASARAWASAGGMCPRPSAVRSPRSSSSETETRGR